MTSWPDLLKERVPLRTRRNSAHMLECIAAVRVKYPNARIVDAGKNLWKLQADTGDLSNAHNSHYDCWAEARALMERAG
jgi:hypothetical protein